MSQTALTLAVRLMAIATGLLSSIATARYLGPEGRGLFFFWSTVAALVVQFGNLGLHASNIYLHARQSIDLAVLGANSLVAAIYAGALITGMVLSVMAVTGYAEASNPLLVVSVLLLSVGGLYSQLGTNLFVAMDRLIEFNVLEIATRLLAFMTLVVVLLFVPDPLVLLAAVGVATALGAGVVGWRFVRKVGFSAPDLDVFRQGLPYGMRAYLIACLAMLVSRLNAFLLEPALTAAEYGAWSIAAQMFDVFAVVPASIALVLLPKMMRSQSPAAMLRANALASGGVMLVMIACFAAVGDHLIAWLYGEAFVPAYGYLLWGAPGLMALAVITILSQYLATVGLPRLLMVLWVVVALVHGLAAPAVIPTYGAAGAMASLSIAYLVGLVLMLWLVALLKGKHA
ncbi:lipopolysaccharide biosynthesis protein [Hydrogenophaga intermedia]|uniref:lipopolysaccharide biosynthesis protein n=1 Tax=Hydrogenophaga intermedia TaxID=65786 RepID=UPI002044ABCB|nr:oligosaccharide flippase family protein [Hydrogenophaga intermedia]MCM3563620.1 hypothetical protein [Hydrogenophaga intermedia]